jgi:hypothetical protein
MKQSFSRLIGLLIAAVMLCFVGCDTTPAQGTPALSDAEAEAILTELLPKSMELMHVFFGEGLEPVNTEAPETVRGAHYEDVKEGQAFSSIAQMKAAMKAVFTTEYQKTLNLLMFDGYVDPTDTSSGDGSDEDSSVDSDIFPRYYETDGVLKIDITYNKFNIKTLPSAEGAKVLSGNDTRVVVQIPYSTEEGKTGTMRVTLALEKGKWLLDGPTY